MTDHGKDWGQCKKCGEVYSVKEVAALEAEIVRLTRDNKKKYRWGRNLFRKLHRND